MPDDDGWGGTTDDGWVTPAGPPPYSTPPAFGGPAQTPPTSVGYPVPAPGAPPFLPPRPSRSGLSGRTILVMAAAAVVVVAIVVVALNAGGGTPTAKGSSSTASHTSSSSSTPPKSPSPTPSPSPTGTTLLSLTPFSGCAQGTPASYPDVKATDEIGCTGGDVTQKVSADQVVYERFGSATDLNSWYDNDVLTANGVAKGTGDCASGQLETTTAQAQYCEGPFTDDTGASARQFLVVAPTSVNIAIGTGSTSAACSGKSSFTLLVLTSPSDNVGIGVVSCTGTTAVATAFETAVQNGDFDLND